MLERVVESWFTSANERSFELPFCQMLAADGHQIIHLSRHGPFEQGKDVITVDSDGTPCAYQLKNVTGKLSQGEWAKYHDQIIQLVEVPIIHPSIDETAPRRVFLVINGELEEEVRREISDRNRAWAEAEHPQLEVIVGGQILAQLKALQTDFWPVRLEFEKVLLEFFLSDGRENLDKPKFSAFISSLFPLDSDGENTRKITRSIASAAVFTSYALYAYEKVSNHVAMFEGWIIFISHLIALAEKLALEEEIWIESFRIAYAASIGSLDDLFNEVKYRRHLIEGNALMDSPLFGGRITWIFSLMAAFALHKLSEDPSSKIDKWLVSFLGDHREHFHLWGEAATPQYLTIFWFDSHTKPPNQSDQLLFQIIQHICEANKEKVPIDLPNPYHNLSDVTRHNLNLYQYREKEHFKGRSYSLESLVHLFARRGWRNKLSSLWNQISRIMLVAFYHDNPWEYCLWQNEKGVIETKFPRAPQSWTDLLESSRSIDVSNIPEFLTSHPTLLLFFLLVFPHRLNPEVTKLLDDFFRKVKLEC